MAHVESYQPSLRCEMQIWNLFIYCKNTRYKRAKINLLTLNSNWILLETVLIKITSIKTIILLPGAATTNESFSTSRNHTTKKVNWGKFIYYSVASRIIETLISFYNNKQKPIKTLRFLGKLNILVKGARRYITT